MSLLKLGRLNPSRTLLLLCDMQEKFAKTTSHFDEIVEASSRLANTANFLEMQTLITEQYPKGLGNTVPKLRSIVPDVPVFEKTKFSMCTEELMSYIQKTRPDYESILLCGIEAHACVLATCVDFLAEGKQVHVVVDAVSSRNLADRKFAIKRMEQSGAFLTTSESVIFQLCRDAKHPKFRNIQKLIATPTPDSNLLQM